MQPDTLLLLNAIFEEHVCSASFVPFISSITLDAMKLFGGYDLQLPVLVALIGSLGGCFLNWILGLGIAVLRARVTFLGTDTFPKVQAFFDRYGFLIAAFYWAPLGAILVIVTGFFRVPLWKTLMAVAVGGGYHLWLTYLA
jgi:membrane protein YqaA with SNARE-associated domain